MKLIAQALLILIWLGAAVAEAEGARVTGASSSLAAKTRVMEWAKGKPDWRAANFQPASAMDGSSATAWCEGAPGPGLGEWIEVEVDQPTSELEIVPGFRKLSHPPLDAASAYPEEQIDGWDDQSLSTCQSNGRPAVMELTTEKGQVLERLQMGDCVGSWFAVSLTPGKYRLRIAQVFPGSRFEDTCIAELEFRPALTQWSTLRQRDFPKEKAQPQVAPQQLPEAIRPLVGRERCRAASSVKVLPQEVSFLGASIDSGRDNSMASIYMAVHGPSGLLQPSRFLSCYWGPRSAVVGCVAEGESPPDSGNEDDPEWVARPETSAEVQQPRVWTGDFIVRWPKQRREQLQFALRLDAKREGPLVVTATRDDDVVETARYTCVPSP